MLWFTLDLYRHQQLKVYEWHLAKTNLETTKPHRTKITATACKFCLCTTHCRRFKVNRWRRLNYTKKLVKAYVWSKIRQSKINSHSVAGPMGQMNRVEYYVFCRLAWRQIFYIQGRRCVFIWVAQQNTSIGFISYTPFTPPP